MIALTHLKAIRRFERNHLGFLQSIEDFDLVVEVGYHQKKGCPLNTKAVHALHLAPPSTVHRRIARLAEIGVLLQTRSDYDRRRVELTLSRSAINSLDRYGRFLTGMDRSTGTKSKSARSKSN